MKKSMKKSKSTVKAAATEAAAQVTMVLTSSWDRIQVRLIELIQTNREQLLRLNKMNLQLDFIREQVTSGAPAEQVVETLRKMLT